MKISLKSICYAAALLAGMSAFQTANAIDTFVQWSEDGTGDGTDASYNIFDINEFDWQSSGDLVVEQDLVGAGSEADGVIVDTFSQWVANALIGDTVEFTIHAQARLNDFLIGGGTGNLPDSISADGTAGGCADGAGCIEVTGVLDGVETAEAIFRNAGTGALTIAFTGISGTYTWYVDTTPDSDVATGDGFIGDTVLVTGDLIDSSGTFTQGGSGSVVLTNSVTSYNTDYIQTDPDSNAPLTGTTFDTLVTLRTGTDCPGDEGGPDCEAAAHDQGDKIGGSPYTVSGVQLTPDIFLADIGLKADANSEFTATPVRVPEPSVLALLGLGLFGIGFARQRGSRRKS